MTHTANAALALVRDEGLVPLVVDLDGTLLRTDLLYEALVRLAATDPLTALRTPAWLREGKAAFKARLADAALLELHDLPVNEDVLALIRRARGEGRRVYLASASNIRHVQALARHMGLFDGAFGSDERVNLGGAEKARLLVEAFGEGGFDYAGNSGADLPVWHAARTAYVVEAPRKVLQAAVAQGQSRGEVETIGTGSVAGLDYARALRVHQWLKNLLILVPALAAHALTPALLGPALLALVAFSLCASSVYLLNDLIDLPSDRAHATKRHRPFACGAIPITHGLVLIPILLLASLALALALSPAFAGVLAGYYCLTLGYSLLLKRILMLDVVVLASLYGCRVVAGSVAFGVVVSEWLTAFCVFFFLSLALIKRAAELSGRLEQGKGDPAGRAYRLADLPVVEMMAAASGFVAVLVMALYIRSPEIAVLYDDPKALWAVCLILTYWIGRVLVLTRRGEMDEDPVVFAATDRTSLFCAAVAGAVVLGASL